jgi:hypothetical protein
VQNRNPSQNYPSHSSHSSHSSIIDQAYLDQLYERTRARPTGERPSTEPSLTPLGDVASTNERTVEQLLDGTELLRVLRELIEWILALAHRISGGDPVDIAAIARLRAAFHAQLAGRPIGIRKTDLLIVFGLLFEALDPSVVFRTVSGTIGDGLAAVLGSESPLSLHITGALDPFASLVELMATPRRASGPHRACPVRPYL